MTEELLLHPVSRRTVISAAAWSAPAVMLAVGVPMATGSVDPLVAPLTTTTVTAVRTVETDGVWQGTGTLAPGFRFGVTGAAQTVDLAVTRVGAGNPTFATVFTKYQSWAWTTYSTYTSQGVSMLPTTGETGNTVGITVNQVDAAVGRYTATITSQTTGAVGTATFEIYKDGSVFKVRP